MNDAFSKRSATIPLIWGGVTLAVLIGVLGTWSILTTLSGAIVAHGQVEVSLSRQLVQHPDGGVVEEILVSEGAAVNAGDVLLRLNGSALQSELSIVENQLFELDARSARLDAQSKEAKSIVFSNDLETSAEFRADVAEILEGQASIFEKQSEALAHARHQRQKQIEQIWNQMAGLSSQAKAIETQINLLASEVRIQQDLLKKGLAQSGHASALEREFAQLDGVMGQLISDRAQAAARITEIEIESAALATNQREKAETELRDVAVRQLELFERKAVLVNQIDRLEIRAPTSGVIFGLKVTTPQSVIRQADVLMYVVPQDRPLLVAARVPVTHIHEVHLGQDVRMTFSALPQRTTPDLYGRIILVSADALADEHSGATYYRIEIEINSKNFLQETNVEIMPGMPVEAYIITADRTPLSYLLKPFTDYFRVAFRET